MTYYLVILFCVAFSMQNDCEDTEYSHPVVNSMQRALFRDCKTRDQLTRKYDKVARGVWNCGSDRYPGTELIAKVLVSLTCASYKDITNNVCFLHDECYIRLARRNSTMKRVCDQVFCNSLSKMTDGSTFKRSPEKRSILRECKGLAKLFCNAVALDHFYKK